jgi:glycosyltransferase involved in cell wall biosynthesis
VRRQAAHHDLVLFLTARAFVPVPVPCAVDHIDCLSENAARRATSYPHAALRLLWREEARRLRRWERQVARHVEVQLVTSPADARQLPARPAPAVIPIGVRLRGSHHGDRHEKRDIDVILTGNMAYPPNRDAATWLAQEIAPRVRAHVSRPVKVVVAGRAAATLPPLDGIESASDVPALAPLLRRAKVAVAPLRIGTGVPNKVLEAALADAALVLTPQANPALNLPPTAAAIADDAPALAHALTALLTDDDLRRRRVAAARNELVRFDLDAITARYETVVRGAATC